MFHESSSCSLLLSELDCNVNSMAAFHQLLTHYYVMTCTEATGTEQATASDSPLLKKSHDISNSIRLNIILRNLVVFLLQSDLPCTLLILISRREAGAMHDVFLRCARTWERCTATQSLNAPVRHQRRQQQAQGKEGRKMTGDIRSLSEAMSGHCSPHLLSGEPHSSWQIAIYMSS